MRYITRKIKTVIAITKCVNLDTMEVEDYTLSIGNVPPNRVIKTIEKKLEGSNLKLIKVIDTHLEENIHKMSEQDFIMYSNVVE